LLATLDRDARATTIGTQGRQLIGWMHGATVPANQLGARLIDGEFRAIGDRARTEKFEREAERIDMRAREPAHDQVYRQDTSRMTGAAHLRLDLLEQRLDNRHLVHGGSVDRRQLPPRAFQSRGQQLHEAQQDMMGHFVILIA